MPRSTVGLESQCWAIAGRGEHSHQSAASLTDRDRPDEGWTES